MRWVDWIVPAMLVLSICANLYAWVHLRKLEKLL